MIWDITLRKTLRHERARFEIDVHFTSAAPRVVLFGPSGAGKTQTLAMIAGIAHPDAGRVAIDGRVLYDAHAGIALAAQQRRLATVFQDGALFPHLTVRQNIAFARRSGWLNPRRDAADAVVEKWIDSFGLAAVSGLYPHQISGGQRQRCALARALVREPVALLLDEPFAALDRALRERLRGELCELQARLGLPMLLITHDEDDVRAVTADTAGAVIELLDGRTTAARVAA